jgi:hypothetical protein
MFKQVAGSAILIIAFSVTISGQPLKNSGADGRADGKWEESIGGAEAVKAIARLGDLSPAAIRESLKQMRQPAYLPGPARVNKIVEAQHLPIAESKRVDQLKAALQPVLDYHRRSQMPIYVLWSDQPKARLVDRSVIIITNRLMISATDEEIRGIVAHELAHEYMWDEHIRAREAKNGKLTRECELFCDAVAAFTLKEIGDDPVSYGRILVRLTIIGSKTGSVNKAESDTHPSLDARKKLNKFLCQRFE